MIATKFINVKELESIVNEIENENVALFICKHEDFIPKISYQSNGIDLRATTDTVLKPGAWELVPNGVKIVSRFDWFVVPRSGLALKHGITVLNAPGFVDWDYRNELGTILINHSKNEFKVEKGMRISQLVCRQYVEQIYLLVDEDIFEKVGVELFTTNRNLGGFGSSGLK